MIFVSRIFFFAICVSAAFSVYTKYCSEYSDVDCESDEDAMDYCAFNGKAVAPVPKCLPKSCSTITDGVEACSHPDGGARAFCSTKLGLNDVETCIEMTVDYKKSCYDQ